MSPDFSLVSTVFNEQRRLAETISDIENQSLKPTQIVITDAGSSDGTFETLQRWSETSSINILVLQKKRCNVAAGRNYAIEHAAHELIVSTDFGCRFHPEWLHSIVTPFENPDVRVVGGAFTVQEDKIVSEASKANYILTHGYNVVLNDKFIPSSRSIAYYKSVWESVGKYCEWLTLAADDLVFGKAIRARNIPIVLVDKPYVYWGRHEHAKAYGKEAFRYGLGDGEARVNQRAAISNTIELIMRYLLFTLVVLFVLNLIFPVVEPVWFVITLFFLPGLRSYVYAFSSWRKYRSVKYNVKTFLMSLWLVEITRINYIRGYIRGYFFSTDDIKQKAAALRAILR
jgi:glycosyltransferase involved in cell wall biosynthesis